MGQDRIIEQRSAAAGPAVVVYPDSDGQPMADNDVQADAMIAAKLELRRHFHRSGEAYVAGDLLLYYEEGSIAKRVAPDVMVVFGVEVRRRPNYLLWAEGKPPDFVMEVSAPRSRLADRTEKRDLYARLGVREYFVFDPGGAEDADDGQDGELLGYRLCGNKYMDCGTTRSPGKEMESEVLGLWLRPEEKLVRFRDPLTGRDLPDYEEAVDGLHAAEAARAEAEAARAEAEAARAEAEAARDESKHALLQEREAIRRSQARIAELEARLTKAK